MPNIFTLLLRIFVQTLYTYMESPLRGKPRVHLIIPCHWQHQRNYSLDCTLMSLIVGGHDSIFSKISQPVAMYHHPPLIDFEGRKYFHTYLFHKFAKILPFSCNFWVFSSFLVKFSRPLISLRPSFSRFLIIFPSPPPQRISPPP